MTLGVIMTLAGVRSYLNKMAEEDPDSLTKDFIVRDLANDKLYECVMVDEGQTPAEILINTSHDRNTH